MGFAAVKQQSAAQGAAHPVEIRVRFEPGLGAALYASLKPGESGPITVARMLGRGRALLQFHGYTLMAHGAPEWKPGESFPVRVMEIGPPLILASARARAKQSRKEAARGIVVDSAVVPGIVGDAGQDARP